ncbi:MAG: hypothetical protein ABJA67_11565 [Chthonomonadales bacterium]
MIRWNRFAAIGGVGIAMFVRTSSIADVSADAKKAITNNYKEICMAIGKKDVRTAAMFMTTDYKDISKRRTIGLEAWKTELSKNLVPVNSISMNVVVKSMKLSGKDIIVSADAILQADVIPQQGAKHHLKSVSDAKDTWTFSGGKWKCKSSETLKETATMDGKLLPSG